MPFYTAFCRKDIPQFNARQIPFSHRVMVPQRLFNTEETQHRVKSPNSIRDFHTTVTLNDCNTERKNAFSAHLFRVRNQCVEKIREPRPRPPL